MNKLKTRRDGQKILLWIDESLIDSRSSSPNGDGGPIQDFSAGLPRKLENGDFSRFSMSKDPIGSLAEVIAFSSKALNSYLMISDKLIGEKEKRIEEKEKNLKEKEGMIKTLSQKLSELEAYIKILEGRY